MAKFEPRQCKPFFTWWMHKFFQIKGWMFCLTLSFKWKFCSFHLHSCEDDYLVMDEPIQGKSKKFCGNQIPNSFNVSSNELKISFKSKERMGRPKPGFVATYTSGTTPGTSLCHEIYNKIFEMHEWEQFLPQKINMSIYNKCTK